MSSRKDIIAAVKKCFAEYEADRMTACIRSLTSSYLGCLETGGDNTYKLQDAPRREQEHTKPAPTPTDQELGLDFGEFQRDILQ